MEVTHYMLLVGRRSITGPWLPQTEEARRLVGIDDYIGIEPDIKLIVFPRQKAEAILELIRGQNAVPYCEAAAESLLNSARRILSEKQKNFSGLTALPAEYLPI